MNAIEIYKKLPRKNCGECRQKMCMPFAFSLLKAEAKLHECPYLTEGEINAIEKMIVHFDWREDLILRLKGEISCVDFNEVAPRIGAKLNGRAILVKCMGREFLIDDVGEVSTNGFISPWIKILLLHYINIGGRAVLSNTWVSYDKLKSGMIKASSFTRDCEEPLKAIFDRDLQKTGRILARLGAETRDDFPTKQAWHINLLPKIPVAILYWPPDNEFASKVKVLFDSTADKFLDAESIIFLVEGLVYNIEAALSGPEK